jgi:hypothetical protein
MWVPKVLLVIITAIPQTRAESQTTVSLDSRIKPPLRMELQALLDSANSSGLPTAALANKALEGISKGADPARILAAIRVYSNQLRQVKGALGNLSARELETAAAALRTGVPIQTLVQMQRNLPKRSLVIPYAVLSTLVGQGIPIADATVAILAQAKRADDQSLMAMSSEVDRNIAAGLPAATALVRAQGTLMGGGAERAGGSLRRP